MRLLLPVLFFGINTILCGLSTEIDSEYHLGSDILVEPDNLPEDKNENTRNIEQVQGQGVYFSKLPPEFLSTQTQNRNVTDDSVKLNERWSKIDELKRKNSRRDKQSKADLISTTKSTTNPPKTNRTRKVKKRRKKVKNREKVYPSTAFQTSGIATTKDAESTAKTASFKNVDKKFEKSHRELFDDVLPKMFTENQNAGEILSRNVFKKRKSHRNGGKKRRKLFSHHQPHHSTSTSSPDDIFRSVEGFVVNTNSLNDESPLNTVHRQQNYQDNWSSGMHVNVAKVSSDSNYYTNDEKNNKNGDSIDGNYDKERDIVSKEDERQRLMAQEEKRKLLQAKRELRRKQKLERIERRKRKGKKSVNPDADTSTQNSITQQQQTDSARSNHSKESFVAQPSIDYFVEKPSNYFDTNDTPTFDIIGVSVKSPTKNLASAENEFSSPGKIVQMPIAVSVEQDKMEILEKIENGMNDATTTLLREDGAQTVIPTNNNNDNDKDDDNQKAVVTLANEGAEGKGYNDDNGDDDDRRKSTSNRGDGGDLSCLRDDFQPAPEVPHADIKYLRNEEYGTENAFLEVEYICHHGYRIQYMNNSENHKNIYCRNGRWIGIQPKCVHVKNLTEFNETCNFPVRCEQLCYVRNGIEKCTCHRGFRMRNNRCEDINECAENISDCEFGCVNTVGSYQCKCPKGLRVGDANSCIDVNECLLRNGHGPCQDTCINTWGSYKCSCDSLPNTQLSIDGHSCTDIDECTINNGGCSHTCLNTMGRAFCLCPEGWTLDSDWKTCLDIDECAEDRSDSGEQRCEFGCINTPGSYSCLVDFGADQPIEEEVITECSEGFRWNKTTENCEDVDECAENNGGCYHDCVNNVGSYHCSCRPGYIFTDDKYTCVVSNSSSNISCPALFPPKHGYLECSRPMSIDVPGPGTDVNGVEGQQHPITNRPGSQCVLRCPTGFRINGKFSKHCSDNGAWVGEGDGTCIRYPKPKLICPTDIVLEPSPNQTMAKLKIPRPKTDVNYERDVSVSPGWFRNSEVALEVGVRNVTYTARHPVSKLSVSCSFKVTVLEGEPAVVKFCPQTQTYTLNKQHDSIKIAWNEPIFLDNVNVTEISRTNSPGNSFGVGSHQIVYIAKDQAGHETKCTFKILVNVPYKPILNHPLPIYHMFYKK